jgi:type I site-specific restriction endonuclease
MGQTQKTNQMSNQIILEKVSQLVASVAEKQTAKAAAQLAHDNVVAQLSDAKANHASLVSDVSSNPVDTAAKLVHADALVSVLTKHVEAAKVKVADAEKDIIASARQAARSAHHVARQITDFTRQAERSVLNSFVTQHLLPFGSQAIEEVLKASRSVYSLSEYQRRFQACWSANPKEAAEAVAKLGANWQAFVSEYGKTEIALLQPK